MRDFSFSLRAPLVAALLCRSFLISWGFNDSIPLVTNSTAREYNAELQNWCAQQDNSGLCYFGNNAGVLCYDGFNWELWPMPNNSIARSLLVDGDTIYAGAFEEFGFFLRDEFGDLVYTSIASALPKGICHNEDIWTIIKQDKEVYFQSFAHIYKYETGSGQISVLSENVSGETGETEGKMDPLYLFSLNGHFFVQRLIRGGFYHLTTEGWEKVWNLDQYGSSIVALTECDDTRPFANDAGGILEGCLVCTQDDGLYKVRGGKLQHFTCDLDRDLASCRINRVIRGSNGEIIIGTIGKGVYAMDRDGHRLWHIDYFNGLNNSCVLGLMQDRSGNIWAALDDGISLIHTGVPYTLIRSDAGDMSIGMGYAVGKRDDNLIIATNQGAYVFNTTDKSFKMIEGTIGQNWCVRTFDRQTFIGGNEKTLIINPDGSKSYLQWNSTDIKKGLINGNETLVQSTYYSLYTLTRSSDNGLWSNINRVKGFGSPVRQVEIDNDGTVWLSHISKGVIHATLSASLDSLDSLTEYPSLVSDTVGEMCFIMKIRGKVVFTNENGFYLHDENSGLFVPYEKMNSELPTIRKVCAATTVDDSRFWLAAAEAYYLISYENGRFINKLTIPLANFPRASNGANGYVCHTPEGVSYFILNEAVGCINIEHLPHNHFSPTFKIKSVGYYDNASRFTHLPLSNGALQGGDKPEVTEGNLEITLSYPNYQNLPFRFSYDLDGRNVNIDTITTSSRIRYPRLEPGDYTLRCGVIDENGDQIADICYQFFVPWPWYLRWWAFALYIAILAIAISIGSRAYSRRQMRKRQQEFDAIKAEQERHISEQQLIIAEQQKKLLEAELSTKSKELASVSFDAYSRQQVIDNLRDSLADQRRKGSPIARDAERVLNAISQAETGSREFWSVFERNFDLIHEHFFRNLLSAFPQLTPSDMKFCALLRLNLSTKDIARFTNITVRGVETARYRLRRKFALEPSQSLVQFLIDHKPS